jgi:hypothetical protein
MSAPIDLGRISRQRRTPTTPRHCSIAVIATELHCQTDTGICSFLSADFLSGAAYHEQIDKVEVFDSAASTDLQRTEVSLGCIPIAAVIGRVNVAGIDDGVLPIFGE